MRAASARWAPTLRTGHGVAGPTVLSYLGNSSTPIRTAPAPVIAGTITWDDTGQLRSRLQLTVAAYDPITNLSWDPGTDPAAPLAAFGQRLRVQAGLIHSDGVAERLSVGQFLIESWRYSEAAGQIDVLAVDLAQLLVDDRIARTEVTPSASTYFGEAQRRVGGVLPTALDPGLANRPIGSMPVWEAMSSRADQLDQLCAAWPARWYVSDAGVVTFAAPYGTDYSNPVVRVLSGPSGTVVDRDRSGERGRIYNRVVVNGQPGAGNAAGPTAIATINTGPLAVTGPYGVRTRFYTSSMITTQAQADGAAAALLQKSSVAGRGEAVLAVPDARIQLGDVAQVSTPGGGTFNGRVQSITLPLGLTGPMGLTVVTQPT